MTEFAAALSEHPVASHATGEVVGQVLEALGPAPDLAVLFASPGHAGTMQEIVGAVHEVLGPGTLLGATAGMVLGGPREVEGGPALSLWAARLGPVRPLRVRAGETVAGPVGEGDVLVLLADPFTTPVEDILADLQGRHPTLQVVGGLASAARGPGGNRLVLDDEVLLDGAVGVLLRRDQVGASVVSQGCRPVGEPMIVTRAERSVIYELAGKPALEQLMATVEGLDPGERHLLASGIHLGVVIDEHRAEFGRGDFLVRNVLGADRSVGAIAVGDEVPVGATVQFHARDASSADEDLRELIGGHTARASLVFTCNGRGTHLFGRPDHDATVVHELLDRPAIAGMSCAGELGPVGGRSFLHGFTASVLTFR